VLKLRGRIPPEGDPIRQLKFATHHWNEARPPVYGASRLHGLLSNLLVQQTIDCLLRFACGSEDCALVAIQDFESPYKIFRTEYGVDFHSPCVRCK